MNEKQKQEIESILEEAEFAEQKPGLWTRGEIPGMWLVDMNVNEPAPEFAVIEDSSFERVTDDLPAEFEALRDKIWNKINECKKTGGCVTPTSPVNSPSAPSTELNRAPQAKHDISLTTANTPDLSIDTIKKYINPRVTDQEAYAFLQLCQYRELNPFLNEAYLIKYGDEPATIVVGKDAFIKRAEEHPAFDGYEAGVIVENRDGEIGRRKGAFYTEGEELLGGWASVHRKDRGRPFTVTVRLSEFVQRKRDGSPTKFWKTMPATMIRKVALVQALREAFPSDLGGMYDACERPAEVSADEMRSME